MCTERGHSVTLYSTRASCTGLVDIGRFAQDSLVLVDRSFPAFFVEKIWRYLHRRLGDRLTAVSPLLRWISKREADSRRHQLYIGIEKKGLIVAGWVSSQLSKPSIYYSLELYIGGHPAEKSFCDLWREELYYHRLTAATIIQDRMRAAALLVANGLPTTARCLLLPVGVRRARFSQKRDWLRARFSIPAGVFIILYLGVIAETRHCQYVADMAAHLGDDYAMVFHGPLEGDPPKLRTRNVFLSTELVKADELEAVVASADIGIALYDNKILNDRLTAFSSQKVAMYLRAGLPFVARRNESYAALAQEYACCELIEEFSELPEAIRRIRVCYDDYATNAREAFERYYCLDKTLPPVVESLARIASGQRRQMPEGR